MTNFGIVCPSAIGHLNPMCALGSELQRRNHKVTIFGIADIETKVNNSGLHFYLIGEKEFPLGWLEKQYETLGKTSGKEARKFTIQFLLAETKMLFNNLPAAIQSTEIEALIVDQVSSAGGTVADKLNIPYVTVCNALLINREAGVPPYFTPWDYNLAWWAKLRNRVGNWLLNRLSAPIWQSIQQQRKEWGLPLHSNRDSSGSQLAQICQLPQEFDFPRKNLADCFHYVGALQNPSKIESIAFKDIAFPWERLNDKPLVYASLGTLQNKIPEVFQAIAKAIEDLNVQLVISLGNPHNDPADYDLPDDVVVVSFAPHQQLIERSSLIITHAGMNTTLGALSSGVPIVAIPITNEQPGIAARLARTGAGEVLALKSLTVSQLKKTIDKVLTENSYKQNALRMQQAISQGGGVKKAADIVEEAIN